MSTGKINVELKVTDNLNGAVNAVIIGQNNVLLACFAKTLIFDFHKDWNHLMMVVEKIERLRSGVLGMESEEILAYITITENYCEVQTIECIFEPEEENCSKIEAVYSTVVQFVKWYNSKPVLHE